MSGIKDCIISRWGDDGVIIDADYSQLEVIGLAHLSQDIQLQNDLMDGLDMHSLNASILWGIDYETIYKGVQAGDPEYMKKRKSAKGPGFLIQYGGGAQTMAKNTGVPYKQCKKFISGYYDRYFQVKRWQDANILAVKRSRKMSSHRTVSGFPAGQGELHSITGRIYTFIEEDAPSFNNKPSEPSFSPTKIKNYPVQGFATGDIVPHIIGHLYRRLLMSEQLRLNCLLINTVHDSILFDCKRRVLGSATAIIKRTMERAPTYLRDHFCIKNFTLPLKVDVQAGPSWGNVKPLQEVV